MKLSLGDESLKVDATSVEVEKNDGSFTDQASVNALLIQEITDLAANAGGAVTVSDRLPDPSDGDDGEWWIYNSILLGVDFGEYSFKRKADTPGTGFLQCLDPGGPPDMDAITSIQFDEINYDGDVNNFDGAFPVGSEIKITPPNGPGTYRVLAKAEGFRPSQVQLDVEWVGGVSTQLFLGNRVKLSGDVINPGVLFFKDQGQWIQIGGTGDSVSISDPTKVDVQGGHITSSIDLRLTDTVRWAGFRNRNPQNPDGSNATGTEWGIEMDIDSGNSYRSKFAVQNRFGQIFLVSGGGGPEVQVGPLLDGKTVPLKASHVATSDDHVVNKKFLDNKVRVSDTVPLDSEGNIGDVVFVVGP